MNKHKNINQVDEAASDERLRAALTAAYPASEAPPQLRERVEQLATRRPERPAPWWKLLASKPLGIGFGLAGATVLLVIAATSWPKLGAAQALQQMDAALTDVRSAHIVYWEIKADGSRVKQREEWFQKGRSRIEGMERGHRTTQIYASGRAWIYTPESHKVIVRNDSGLFFSNALIRFKFSEVIRNDKLAKKVVMLGNITINGHSARQVSLEEEDGMGAQTGILVLIDANTDLPIQAEVETPSFKGQRPFKGFMEFHFNESLPAKLFKPEFPKSTLIVDRDKGKAEWQRRLNKSIARKKVGDRTIVIRDLQVNRDGQVFLLYTTGKRPRDGEMDWELNCTDEFGTSYEDSGNSLDMEDFQAYLPGAPSSYAGFVLQGQKLEGTWLIPIKPQVPWKPRRFTFTFFVNRKDIHGTPEELMNPKISLSYTERAVFKFRVPRPTIPLIPGYMPYMGHGPGDEKAVRRIEAKLRAR